MGRIPRMSPVLPFRQAFPRLPLAAKFALIALAAALVALTLRLWPEWRHNPDLSHGLFMPVIFLLLVHEARRTGTPRFVRPGGLSRLAFGALLTGALLALAAAGLYAAAVDWSHALVNLMLTLSGVLFLGAALFALADDRVRFIGINWSIVAGVLLWLLCTPIPPGTYTRLTLGLQLWISGGVVGALHVLGIAAVRHGNIIELAQTTVGVEEACSGVRSLISCVFAGVFFSATFVRRPWARTLLIAIAGPLAIVMNFLRSLALTLLANGGVDISGAWHDATGFAVLGITALMLGGLALGLEHGEKPAPVALPASDARQPAQNIRLRTLAAGLTAAAILVGVFVVNTRPSGNRNAAAPDLMGLLPATFNGWEVVTSDLYEFAGTLHTDHLAQRRYIKGPSNDRTEITLYMAYWHAGQAPVSLVASHTPDACWPGSGWVAVPTKDPRPTLIIDARRLPDPEYRLFETGDFPQYVWFWHIYDGRPISYRDPYSPVALLHIALRYGFRHGGDQVFIRVSSNRPWRTIANEPLLAEFFARTKALGL
jgi:exosortase